MTKARYGLMAASYFAVFAVTLPCPASTLMDPDNDAYDASVWGVTSTPDLVSANVTYDASQLYLSVRVKPGSMPPIDPITHKGTTFIQFLLDTDQDPSTGQSISNPPSDTAYLGWERQWGFSSAFPTAGVSDGFETAIPLSTIADDGLVNFKVIVYVQLGQSSSTPILDVLSDVGLPAGRSNAVPEPSLAICLSSGIIGVARLRRRRKV